MDILQKIKAGTDHTKLIEWPGTGEKVLLKIPNDNDELQASLSTHEVFKENKENKLDLGTSDAYDFEREAQILYRCILNPETKKPLFKDVFAFRGAINSDLKIYFSSELATLQDEYSPDYEKMTEEKFKEFLDLVKKNPSETIGNISSINIARKLIVSLVNQLPK